MAALTISRYMLECDGCGVRFGEPDGIRSAMELRAAAYGAGWRFPKQVGKAGRPLQTASDACPDCIGTWTPLPRKGRARQLTQDEQITGGRS